MKIIHCADIHLGSSLTAHFDKEQAKKRSNELFKTFLDLLEYAKEHKVEAVLIAGDLFDTNHASKKNVYKAMELYPDIDFYYLRGNHDTKPDGSILPGNVYSFDRSWKSYPLKNHESICVTGMECDLQNKNTMASMLTLNPSHFNIVLLHGQESEYDVKKDAQVLPLKELRNKHIDYLALGHIHSYKQEALDNRGVYCYPGCLEGRGFDETGKHGFVLLDIDEIHHSYTSTFVPFAKREVFVEQLDVTDVESSVEVVLKMKELSHIPSSSIVQIQLVGEVALETEIDCSFIEEQCQELFTICKVKDHTQPMIDYSLYELDSSLKGEFVRTVKNNPTLNEEQKKEIIKLGLSSLEGKEI